ncbi:MAG: hypothetical protein KF760_34345 [Candidatus Eremiobacteraeota bacterium]|nr:hypothetical protein [Candidatus Eremiobacteraeota bacterium]MCW5871337.1 hypothetical protein [Candidatus Eremiobacteraeota bacterium]
MECDWYGQRTGFPLKWSLEVVGSRLEFAFECGCPAACEEVSGFVEGLWRRDVAEFFLIAADGSYQEFNLSPTGAWWSARFRGYRDQERECRCTSVVTSAGRSRAGWKAWLSIAVAEVIAWERFQVTAILGGRYFSTGKCSGEPDFHKF